MSGKFRPQKQATLPNNPKWFVIEATDADPSRWPKNTISNPDAEGNVNFMDPVSVEDGVAIKWRIVVGQALAEMLSYPDVESKSWVLKDWPRDYHLYDHNKGQLNGNVRHDLYLVGSMNVGRFRSPQEFIPHAYWLMTNPEQDRSKCACKYCAGKPQREISDAMGLSQRQSESARFVELPRREKRRHALPAREGRVFATVRQIPKPVKLPKGPKQFVNPDREKDLRAILGPKTLGERRWAREGELVWVKLDFPIPLNDRGLETEEIIFWPGMVEEINFKAQITPRQTSSASSSGSPEQTPSKRGSNYDDLDPWTIEHKSIYKIKLLVVSKTVMYGGDHILPYQSHAPDADLLGEVQSVVFDLDSGTAEEIGGIILPSEFQGEDAERVHFKRLQAFDPFPPARASFDQAEDQKYYSETAAGAFATAIQIASRFSLYYTPFDGWEYKVHADSSPSDFADAVTTATPGLLTLAEEHALRQRHAGAQNSVVNQTRFQGLWWGPERIWMGDLVRLKLGRYEIAPEGTETIKKPSGAGKRSQSEASRVKESHASVNGGNNPFQNGNTSAVNDPDVQMDAQAGDDTSQLGASSRSVFLRVDGIFVVQVPTEDDLGRENQARMCGMLYELADDDWEPEDDEFGTEQPEIVADTNDASASQERRTSSEATLPVPQDGAALADTTNESAAVPPIASSSSTLFAPNPELLSEPLGQPDVVMADGYAGPSAPFMSSSVQPNGSMLTTLAPTGPTTARTENGTPTNVSLSGPLKSFESDYPTPPPPPSLKFRPILRDGHEVVMPLTTLAGRYYPGILSNSLLVTRVRAAMDDLDSRESKAIRALEGLVPGVYNSVDASVFLPRRSQMLREAENTAWREMVDYWRHQVYQRKNAIIVDDD